MKRKVNLLSRYCSKLKAENFSFHSKDKYKGFTLIELLVVVAIIGILATIVMISLTSAQQKSRDAKRISDLKQIDLAINSFYADKQHLPGGLGSFTIYAVDNNNFGGGDSCYSSSYNDGEGINYTSGTCSVAGSGGLYGGQCNNISGGLKTYIPDICKDYGPKHTTAVADAYKDVYLYGFADANKDTYHLGAQFESSNNQGSAFTYCNSSSNCSATHASYTGYYLMN